MFKLGYWTDHVTMKNSKIFLALKEITDLEIHVSEVRKKGRKYNKNQTLFQSSDLGE